MSRRKMSKKEVKCHSLIGQRAKENVTHQNAKHEYRLRQIGQMLSIAHQIPCHLYRFGEYGSIEIVLYTLGWTLVGYIFIGAGEFNVRCHKNDAHLMPGNGKFQQKYGKAYDQMPSPKFTHCTLDWVEFVRFICLFGVAFCRFGCHIDRLSFYVVCYFVVDAIVVVIVYRYGCKADPQWKTSKTGHFIINNEEKERERKIRINMMRK